MDTEDMLVNAWFPNNRSFLRSLGRGFFLLIVAAYFAYSFGANGSFLDLKLYAEGRALTPYQYRVLPMFVFRLLLRLPLVIRLAQHDAPAHNDPYRLILTGIAIVSMLGAMHTTRLTIARLTGDDTFGFWASFLVAYMGLLETASSFGLMYTLPYDIPALFFFAAGIYLIVSGRRCAFFLLFPIAVLNRETSCFNTVFYAVWEWWRLCGEGANRRARIVRIAPFVLAQALIWVAIKVLLARHFSHNPVENGATAGGLFINKLSYNLHELAKPQQWPVFLSVCGFSLPFLYLQRQWIRCQGLSYACGIILPIYFAGMMMVGVLVEIRIFTEWIALVVPAVALIVHNRFRPVAEID